MNSPPSAGTNKYVVGTYILFALIPPLKEWVFTLTVIKRTEINELTDLVSGSIKRRVDSKSENSYFKSIGVGIEDLAIARFLYSSLSGKD